MTVLYVPSSLDSGLRILSLARSTVPVPFFFFFFFFTLVTGPKRSLSLKLSDTRVYEPQIRARLVTTAHPFPSLSTDRQSAACPVLTVKSHSMTHPSVVNWAHDVLGQYPSLYASQFTIEPGVPFHLFPVACPVLVPLSSESGTHKAVTTRFWP